jgi:hypothetical protein
LIMDIEKTYEFIQDYYELCKKYQMFIIKCSCEECDELFPFPFDEDWELEEVYENLIEWFISRRQDCEMEN